MKWGLYAFRDKSQTEDAAHEFSLIRDAASEEIERVRAAIADLAAHSLRKTYVLAVQNYERFNEAEAEIIELIEGSPQSEWPEPTEMGDTLQSHFLNWLLSARAFLESTESQLKRRYGKDSPQVGRFKAATARHHDSKFSYRFLYRLRNYAQHWDWPQLEGRIQVDSSEDPSKWLELFFNKSTLLAFRGWGTVREELENLPGEIHLEDHVDQMMEAIRDIAARAYEIDSPGMKESLRLLGTYWDAMESPNSRPCFLYGDPESGDEGFQVLWIPFKPAEDARIPHSDE
jgi:hypothetical protein